VRYLSVPRTVCKAEEATTMGRYGGPGINQYQSRPQHYDVDGTVARLTVNPVGGLGT